MKIESYCLNEPAQIEGGMNGNQVVGAQAGLGETSITEFFGTMLYLPDGFDENYTTTIDVSGFPEGTTISSASNLAALCVNMSIPSSVIWRWGLLIRIDTR